MRKQPTGEPVAGEPHTGFGRRGGLSARPDPYCHAGGQRFNLSRAALRQCKSVDGRIRARRLAASMQVRTLSHSPAASCCDRQRERCHSLFCPAPSGVTSSSKRSGCPIHSTSYSLSQPKTRFLHSQIKPPAGFQLWQVEGAADMRPAHLRDQSSPQCGALQLRCCEPTVWQSFR